MPAFRVEILALLAVLVACGESHPSDADADANANAKPNEPPVAVARVVLARGPADETTFAEKQDALAFDFSGAPIDVQLDGTASSDEDGEIEKYEWQSAGLVDDDGTPLPDDTKVPSHLPERNEQAWSADVPVPTVRIAEPGVYTFNLWVTDDMGATGEPDRVTFRVGTSNDETATQCKSSVAASVPAECSQCLCGASDMCQQVIAETSCREPCWGLLRCLNQNCPNFRSMAMAMDFSCVTSNCGAHLAAGQRGANPVIPCLGMCPDECRVF
ncbi:MAG TPA: PKD domain-containing protein [Polyangiaceae bacterium]|nr:PKD domain-containing protein [Polyangiaceae bacterium]